jgi:hypothetical protein
VADFQKFVDAGINTFDTGPEECGYGPSERIIGEYLKQAGDKAKDVQVFTKAKPHLLSVCAVCLCPSDARAPCQTDALTSSLVDNRTAVLRWSGDVQAATGFRQEPHGPCPVAPGGGLPGRGPVLLERLWVRSSLCRPAFSPHRATRVSGLSTCQLSTFDGFAGAHCLPTQALSGELR